MVKKESLKIIENKQVADGWFVMELSIHTSHPPLPGQFISVSFPHLLYRRPFAISNYKKDESISILYQVQQKSNFAEQSSLHFHKNATQSMSTLIPGDVLDCMYYHGNTFSYHSEKAPILVAGGIGLGPLLYFSQWLVERHSTIPTFIFGARTSTLIPLSLFSEYPITPHIVTDDGSSGLQANTIDVLERILLDDTTKNAEVYLCGPLNMMYAGAKLCKQNNITAWASFDTIMACSMGACVGCVIPIMSAEKTTETPARTPERDAERKPKEKPEEKPDASHFTWNKACIQGPIFNTTHVIWEKLYEH